MKRTAPSPRPSLRRRLRGAVLALTAVAATLHAAPASANGRYPESNGFFFSKTDPDLIVLRVTFGLIVSRDRGNTWDWICEYSVGLAGVEDPMFTLTPGGTWIGSTFQGLTVSRDQGCSFAYEQGALKDRVFIDVTTTAADPSQVVVFSSSYDGMLSDGGIVFKSTLFETKDDGRSYRELPAAFDANLLSQTVDVAPSDPDRFYVTTVRSPGQESRTTQLLVSRDHATTFEEHDVPVVDTERALFIAAVDPTNPDRVYLRTSNAVDRPSRLIVTDDAGLTYRTVFTSKGLLMGFALSPDGSKVWVGGPLDGVHMASTTDFAFQQRSNIEVQCLVHQSDGLWACSTERVGFIAGLSKDDGATFEPKLRFCEIRGPLACPEGTSTHLECTLGGPQEPKLPPWPPQRQLLGCETAVVDAGGTLLPDASTSAPGASSSGSGCAVRSPSSLSPFAAIAAGAGAIFALVRRRRRR